MWGEKHFLGQSHGSCVRHDVRVAVASCSVPISDNLFCMLESELDCGPSVAGRFPFWASFCWYFRLPPVSCSRSMKPTCPWEALKLGVASCLT